MLDQFGMCGGQAIAVNLVSYLWGKSQERKQVLDLRSHTYVFDRKVLAEAGVSWEDEGVAGVS